MHIADGYIENLFFGNGWKRLARILATNPGRITPIKDCDWIGKIAKGEQRPRTYEIAKMVGIIVTAKAHDVLVGCEKEEKRRKNANVVSLRKKK